MVRTMVATLMVRTMVAILMVRTMVVTVSKINLKFHKIKLRRFHV